MGHMSTCRAMKPGVRRKRSGDFQGRLLGVTLIELLIVIAVIGILASAATAIYTGQIKRARRNVAIADIQGISLKLAGHFADTSEYPLSLDEVGLAGRLDPWGHPYRYLRIAGALGKGGMRKDRFLVPLNSDFDLYSMGPDGLTQAPLSSPVSRDDIIRANDGKYIGVALSY